MEANFFRQIADLNLTGSLQLTIAKGAENRYVVSVLLINGNCGDQVKRTIPPLNIRATPDELDKGFFETITKPMQTVSGLMVDMESFMKQVEVAKKNSGATKSNAVKGKTETKASKYDTAMATVDELDKAGKPRDAWMKLPDPADFPDHADEIRKRRSELSAQFAPDLFADPQPEPPQPTNGVDAMETDEPTDDDSMMEETVSEDTEETGY